MTQAQQLDPVEGVPAMSASALLSIRAVNKSFGSNAVLRNVSINVNEGEFLTFLGESGSGKTTLLRLIAGFENLDSGEIWMDKTRIDALPPYRRCVNTVFQQYALFPHMSVRENVAYGLRIARIPKAEIESRVLRALAMVKMSQHAAAMPAKISGGQQQRVALARALVNRPQLLLLDEPLSALDANLRAEMQLELKALQRELGITFIFVTHDQQEALSMSDRIALLRSGQIEQLAPPQQIYQRPASAYVARFLGQTNLIPFEICDRIATSGGVSIPCTLPDGSALASLRPEAIRVWNGAGSRPDIATFSGKITTRVFHGSFELVEIDTPLCASMKAKLSPSAHPEANGIFEFSIGDVVFLPDREAC
jgi:ABC-type Fe3+/spermidine/putrescine transport system ATPase subunit